MGTIIFDMDDTLLVEENSARAAFMATCHHAAERCGIDAQQLYVGVRSASRMLWHEAPGRAYCLRVGISSWEGLWAEFVGEGENLRMLRRWSNTYRDTSWRNALLECGVDDVDLASELGNIYVAERRALHVVFDDVAPALERLCQAHNLGLLTNGCPDLQRRKLDASGLSRFFDEVVIAGEVGIGKPDTRVFELLLSRMPSSPSDAAMVGNSLRSDIQPANALGMTSVWVNRTGKPSNPAIVPDIEVASLAEMLGFDQFNSPSV
jgi:putative hydrolase of the HAD superfamily